VSCLDEFLGKEDDSPSHPEWLNESVYDYLVKDGNYKYFLNLIDSAGYAEVLQKTGSKTLFVANDSTFEAFLNERGTTFENLSAYDRQAILFSNMLNNTYLLEMLSRQQGNPPAEGQVMRRITEWNPLMALQFTPPDSLPDNPYWARFREKGPALIAKDEHSYTMIHFLQTFLQSKGITDADFELITGRPRQPDDIFIFDARVKPNPALPQQYGDIACKNGYVNEVDKVLYPVDNLSEYIRKNPSTQIFNRLLDRFSFPIYASTMTQEYRRDVDPTYADSVFAKHYFSLVPEPRYAYDPSDSRRSVPALRFDPGANNYSSSGTRAIDIQTDMAAMFIPTDEAMQQYLSPQGAGSIIIDRYGTIEEIPDDIVKTLLDNHMWSSFINTVPSRFHTIAETNDVTLGITQADIAGARICSNGIAYMTNKVYSPSEFSSVIAPVTFNDNAAIVRKGIKDTSNPFDVYLNSMVNKFSFFVYTDSVMNNYINPASIAKDRLEPEGIRFADIPRDASQIRAVLYKPLVSTDSVRAITNAVAKAMLKDIIDNNIVIGTLEEGKEYYSTKGGATIRILPGTGLGAGMKVQGRPAMTLLTETEDAITATVTAKEEQKNGATFFLDKIVQPPLYSVYHILSDTVNNPQFSEFFYLCSGAMEVADPNSASLPKVSKPIFVNEIIFKSANLIVSFFNTFNYSVYVPTNQAVREYILREFPGLNATPETIWDEIRNMEDLHDQAAAAKKLYDFLLYHFQDNSVYIRGGSEPQFYETALLNPESKRFRRLYVVPEGENLKVYSEKEGEKHSLLANVITTTPDYYNIMARDCQFTSNNTIETSSFAVIHQIDNVLEYDK
jgi:uncharacterized surface protein with fasciclin (FAS1) repeats